MGSPSGKSHDSSDSEHNSWSNNRASLAPTTSGETRLDRLVRKPSGDKNKPLKPPKIKPRIINSVQGEKIRYFKRLKLWKSVVFSCLKQWKTVVLGALKYKNSSFRRQKVKNRYFWRLKQWKPLFLATKTVKNRCFRRLKQWKNRYFRRLKVEKLLILVPKAMKNRYFRRFLQ